MTVYVGLFSAFFSDQCCSPFCTTVDLQQYFDCYAMCSVYPLDFSHPPLLLCSVLSWCRFHYEVICQLDVKDVWCHALLNQKRML